MNTNIRDTIAVLVTIAAIAVGGLAALHGRVEPGLDLERQPDGTVVVSRVWPGGTAFRTGIEAGMVVEYITDESGNVDGTLRQADEQGRPLNGSPPKDPIDPAPDGTYWFAAASPQDRIVASLSQRDDGRLSQAGGEVGWAVVILLLGVWLRVRPTLVPAGDPDLVRRVAIPAAAALAVPVALVPAYLAGMQIGLWSLVVLPALGSWPLVDATATLSTRRSRGIAMVLLLAGAASWLAGITIQGRLGVDLALFVGPLAIFAAVLVSVSAAVLAPNPPPEADFEGRLRGGIRTFDLLLVLGGTVAGMVALGLSTAAPGDWANVAKIWLVFVALRLVVVPFIASARRARASRDSALDAVEAERVRISGEIHDDVIQELTMLVRRLDASADHESAAIAREAAGRLREITGDARLPVLDDLGVAAALDWLVQRMSVVDNGQLSLEADEAARPPRSVEVAVFRVAQEAVANALRHGAAPVSVTYRATADRATLEVVDGGPGIPDQAEEIADGAGRLGIAGMRRRAAAIDATLRIHRPEQGGTRVLLEWGPA
jgi:signal transduction histidine kinase